MKQFCYCYLIVIFIPETSVDLLYEKIHINDIVQ